MTKRKKTAGRRPSPVLVPIVAALYATSACAGFWDQPVDKGPRDYLSDSDFQLPSLAESWPDPEADYAAVCADPVTQQRVDDYVCASAGEQFDGADQDAYQYATTHNGSGSPVVYWYYYPTQGGLTAPAVGGRLNGGTYTTPRGTGGLAPVIVRTGAVPKTGGTVTKSSASTNTGIQRGGLGVPQGGSGSARSGAATGSSGGGGKSGGS
jgi:hypothetical protein